MSVREEDIRISEYRTAYLMSLTGLCKLLNSVVRLKNLNFSVVVLTFALKAKKFTFISDTSGA